MFNRILNLEEPPILTALHVEVTKQYPKLLGTVRILHILWYDNFISADWIGIGYEMTESINSIINLLALTGFHAGQLHVYFSQRVTEEGKRYPSTANGFYGFLFGLAGCQILFNLSSEELGRFGVAFSSWSKCPQSFKIFLF